MRTIQSPGVEIREFDLTSRLATFAGTDVFVTGFTPKGPTDEIIKPSSMREFEAIYGIPQTPAERYLYYSVEPLINAGANVYLSRIPYGSNLGEGFGTQYGALVYPAIAVTPNQSDAGKYNTVSTNLASASATYVLGEPIHFALTKSEYLSAIDGSSFTWTKTASAAADIDDISKFGGAGVVVFNKGLTTINDKFEGYYIGLSDNTNTNPALANDSIRNAYTIGTDSGSSGNGSDYTQLPGSRLNFSLSGSNVSLGTVSQTLESTPGFDVQGSDFDDVLSLGVFKLRQSLFSPDTIKLDYYLEDGAVGSLDYHRQIGDTLGGDPVTFHLEPRVNETSRNITVMINDNISNRSSSTWLDNNGVPEKAVRIFSNNLVRDTYNGKVNSSTDGDKYRVHYNALTATDFKSTLGIDSITGTTVDSTADNLYPVGAYSDETFTDKNLGSIPLKLDRVLDLVRNDEVYNIDVTVEAGLGTIYAAASANGTSYYDDIQVTSGLRTGLNALANTSDYDDSIASESDLRGNYNAIFSRFQQFAELERKDHIFVADPLRHILIQGDNSKTINNPNKSWSQHIFSPLRHQFNFANSSYACTYANWIRVNDRFSGANTWVPFSGTAASLMARTDTDTFPWYAPAGFTRGRVLNADDIAVTPNLKQRDDLYKFAMNPVTLFRDGITVFGQKTLQKMPSAFDRINVRRLFLYLEKVTKNAARYYVFEPNTLFTRTRVVDDLRPLFEFAKNNDGVYDYIVVCDERNNTPDVIDKNELIIDIYLKPVRAAEFILVNFYATRTGADFEELIN